MDALKLAGYRSEKMISSGTTIIFSYVLYLIGLRDYGVDRVTMRQTIAEFFFMAAYGRYTNSPETRFESRPVADPRSVRWRGVSGEVARALHHDSTGDYWTITLPSQLATSASRSPSLFAYQAALIKLDANVLYSPLKISAMVDPAVKGTKAALEQHHLFPRGYLEETGIDDLKQINQIANFAAVEWPANIKIGKKPPADYVPPLDHAMSADERDRLYGWHALPPLWWELPYHEFLVQRRVRMGDVICQAWELLTVGSAPAAAVAPIAIADLIAGGETRAVEFKSTLRMNLHTGQVDDKIQVSALKTIAGFLNAKGGTLLIGVADNGEVLGLDADGFQNEDKLGLHLVNLVKDRIGEVFLPTSTPTFRTRMAHGFWRFAARRGRKRPFSKDGNLQRFFVRGGNATTELSGASVTDYVKQRFG